jgi:hypothetical protein
VLSAQLALHGVAAELWPGPRTWEPVLVDAARALGVRRDELTDEERAAAASVGAVILAVLRIQVARMSVTDEHVLNFSRGTLAVRELFDDFDPEQVSRLETELREAFGPAVSSETVFLLACDAQEPERGLARGPRLLADDYGIVTQELNGAIELYKELPAAAGYFLLLALGFADDGEAPVVVLGRTRKGAVAALWQAPWFAVDHKGTRGHWGDLYRIGTAYRRREPSPLHRS